MRVWGGNVVVNFIFERHPTIFIIDAMQRYVKRTGLLCNDQGIKLAAT